MNGKLIFFTPLMLLFLTAFTQSKIPEGYTLVYSQDFKSEEAINDFEFTDPEKWELTPDCDGSYALESFGKGNYVPDVRSPHVIALISDLKVKDFILEANLKQTGKEYGHRDMCLFFNVLDPSRYYYVHIATKADPNAHNIFIVNNEPRKNIATETTDGINWGNGWHKVRLVRNTSLGTIELFFDDMKTPIMKARDDHFTEGYLGFGSFDDLGRVDNIRVWAPEASTIKAGMFQNK